MLNLTGGYLNYHNTYSTAQIATATPYMHGTYVGSHFTQIAHSDLVVLFGLNLSETRMSGGGQVEELRRALETSKARVIIIDPRYTDSVITEHAEWLPIRPTTDAALVAGIAHTLITEQLLDEALVNRYCVGYDRSTCRTRLRLTPAIKIMFLARAMTVSRKPGMGGGYHRNSGNAYSPTGARNRLGARLLYLRAGGRSVMPTANKPCVLFRRCQR